MINLIIDRLIEWMADEGTGLGDGDPAADVTDSRGTQVDTPRTDDQPLPPIGTNDFFNRWRQLLMLLKTDYRLNLSEKWQSGNLTQ